MSDLYTSDDELPPDIADVELDDEKPVTEETEDDE
jgi:hypothetical protein